MGFEPRGSLEGSDDVVDLRQDGTAMLARTLTDRIEGRWPARSVFGPPSRRMSHSCTGSLQAAPAYNWGPSTGTMTRKRPF